MILNKNQSGFTMLEILVALAIMTVGFLAMAQMQFLALRQNNQAESGTVATNMAQFISDADIETARRIHLLNSRIYLNAQSGNAAANSTQDDYCDGTNNPLKDKYCDELCPCNPLRVFTEQPNTDAFVSSTCAAINNNSFDPAQVEYKTDTSCLTDNPDAEYLMVRRVQTNFVLNSIPQEINYEISYALKSKKQFDQQVSNPTKYGNWFDMDISKSISTVNYNLSAHIDDWTTFLDTATYPNSQQVFVPHIP